MIPILRKFSSFLALSVIRVIYIDVDMFYYIVFAVIFQTRLRTSLRMNQVVHVMDKTPAILPENGENYQKIVPIVSRFFGLFELGLRLRHIKTVVL